MASDVYIGFNYRCHHDQFSHWNSNRQTSRKDKSIPRNRYIHGNHISTPSPVAAMVFTMQFVLKPREGI